MRRPAIIALVVTTAAVHIGLAIARAYDWVPTGAGWVVGIVTAWAAILLLASLASRQISGLRTDLQTQHDRHQASLGQIDQLAALNEMLLTLGRSKDVGVAFQSLARHIGRLLPCDRLGLALLRDNGQAVLTYSARVSEPERRRRPRPELKLSLEHSVFGQVIRTCEERILPDLGQHAAAYQDAGRLASEGFHSALVLPLISRNRAIGALTVISRQRNAFDQTHADAMQPLAEVLAFAFVSQQQQALDKLQMVESMSDSTLALASELNSALQGVIGEASILRRRHPDLGEGLDAIIRHGERTLALLERVRANAEDRLDDIEIPSAIPASPEAFAEDEAY
jgi:transcriptional regulator with GAF, ATPase, and Fis domain